MESVDRQDDGVELVDKQDDDVKLMDRQDDGPILRLGAMLRTRALGTINFMYVRKLLAETGLGQKYHSNSAATLLVWVHATLLYKLPSRESERSCLFCEPYAPRQ